MPLSMNTIHCITVHEFKAAFEAKKPYLLHPGIGAMGATTQAITFSLEAKTLKYLLFDLNNFISFWIDLHFELWFQLSNIAYFHL